MGMKLIEIAPNLTLEQLANCEIKVARHRTENKVKLAIVDQHNTLLAQRELSTAVAAPVEPNTGTQAEFWRRHHNAWLD